MIIINKKQLFTSVVMFGLLLGGCKTELYGGLDENDANSMLAILLESNIDSEKIPNKKEGNFALNIDDSKIPQAIRLLREHGYPDFIAIRRACALYLCTITKCSGNPDAD